MSHRAHPLAVGAFAAGIALLFLLTLFFFGGRSLFDRSERFVLFFEGSISGLNIGAPVSFQGVQIGEVTGIQLALTDREEVLIPVFVNIRSEALDALAGEDTGHDRHTRLLQRGLRAQLKQQSLLTGLLYIELDFNAESAARLRGRLRDEPEIPTVPTALQALSKTLEDIRLEELVSGARTAIIGINTLVNHPDVLGAVQDARRSLQTIEAVVQQTGTRLDPALTELDATLRATRRLATQLQQDYPPLQAELQLTLTETRRAADRLQLTLAEWQHALTADAPLGQSLYDSLHAIRLAAQSLRQLTDSLDAQPEALLRGKRSPDEEP